MKLNNSFQLGGSNFNYLLLCPPPPPSQSRSLYLFLPVPPSPEFSVSVSLSHTFCLFLFPCPFSSLPKALPNVIINNNLVVVFNNQRNCKQHTKQFSIYEVGGRYTKPGLQAEKKIKHTIKYKKNIMMTDWIQYNQTGRHSYILFVFMMLRFFHLQSGLSISKED